MNSQKAIQHFYEWEQKGRGYFLFPYSIALEPSFQPFYHSYNNNEYVDDGKVPSFFEKLFSKKTTVIQEEINEDPPEYFEYKPFLKQLKISFYRKQDFDLSLWDEFLNMLSDSIGSISFEIIGRCNAIEVQLVCYPEDSQRIIHLFKAYFPELIISNTNLNHLPFNANHEVLIADFGYNEEFMRPINSSFDALTGIMAVMENLRGSDTAMLQIIFKGVENPWANSILNSVKIGTNDFFPESPEMVKCAKGKVSFPLFAAVLRLAVQSDNTGNSERLAYELIYNIKAASRSEYNSLIPISNDGYEYESHLENLRIRGTNRYGMIMNSQELLSFFHLPESSKLISNNIKTKAVPDSVLKNDYLLGINSHLDVERKVTLNDDQRLRHCHIIGATGVGKSTLITNLFLEDIRKGNGCAIFDPHGDTIDDIIPRIPADRLNDVILIDPSDSEYAFGFNLLSAKSEIEKIVLSSDLVEAFKQHSTSWGDQMTSVLSNAINAFLYSNVGGTLVELKRFLLDNSFRKEFLMSVRDISIQEYWDSEFVLLKKVGISPLLTRLDTFLRPRIIRNILSQKEGLDFNEAVNGKKILLIKLAQGLIGEENSYLLGCLILSKIYQVGQSRQSISKEQRNPFYVYIDEFQNFITPSINAILSGSRKYGMGLVLAHQELRQIKDSDVQNSILSNANIRVCFRLGELDAKKIESGFSGFDHSDFQNLNIGDAIVRVGKNTDDFSIRTLPLKQVEENNNIEQVVHNTREKYSKKILENEKNLNDHVLTVFDQETIKRNKEPKRIEEGQVIKTDIEAKSKEYIEAVIEKEEIREHRYLQTFIKKIAEQRGFKATIEEVIENGRVDVSLVKDLIRIACEVAISNSVEYEVKNIKKCIVNGYSIVCVVSKNEDHLKKISEKASNEIKDQSRIYYFTPYQITEFLDCFIKDETKEIQRIKGYRIKVNYLRI